MYIFDGIGFQGWCGIIEHLSNREYFILLSDKLNLKTQLAVAGCDINICFNTWFDRLWGHVCLFREFFDIAFPLGFCIGLDILVSVERFPFLGWTCATAGSQPFPILLGVLPHVFGEEVFTAVTKKLCLSDHFHKCGTVQTADSCWQVLSQLLFYMLVLGLFFKTLCILCRGLKCFLTLVNNPLYCVHLNLKHLLYL